VAWPLPLFLKVRGGKRMSRSMTCAGGMGTSTTGNPGPPICRSGSSSPMSGNFITGVASIPNLKGSTSVSATGGPPSKSSTVRVTAGLTGRSNLSPKNALGPSPPPPPPGDSLYPCHSSATASIIRLTRQSCEQPFQWEELSKYTRCSSCQLHTRVLSTERAYSGHHLLHLQSVSLGKRHTTGGPP